MSSSVHPKKHSEHRPLLQLPVSTALLLLGLIVGCSGTVPIEGTGSPTPTLAVDSPSGSGTPATSPGADSPTPSDASATPGNTTGSPGVTSSPGSNTPAPGGSGPALLVFPSSADFGALLLGDTDSIPVELRNQGRTTLTLAFSFPDNPADQFDLIPSGADLPTQIEPSQILTLSLRFSPMDEGPIEGLLRVESSDPKAPQLDIALSGYGEVSDDELDLDGDGFAVVDDDCDDSDEDIHPQAAEVCDTLDNNCDGMIDDEGPTWYRDADGDKHGIQDLSVAGASVSDCSRPAGYASSHDDCNDLVASAYPGAPELCDSIDNDCDSEVDEDGASVFYLDADGDGYGDTSTRFVSCVPGEGAVAKDGDCNDQAAQIHPEATELCDSMDNDCDTKIDEGVTQTFYLDTDQDGYGQTSQSAVACSAPQGYVSSSGDCADNNSAVNPGAEEICDGLDNNCDTLIDPDGPSTYYRDADEDGYGNPADFIEACTLKTGYVANNDDCDDTRPELSPDATELCDDLDNNCNGQADEGLFTTFYVDADLDGYGNPNSTVQACRETPGVESDNTDCNDDQLSTHPDAAEPCDLIDNNCNGQVDEAGETVWYRDYDQDGHGDPTVTKTGCTAPTGYTSSSNDCNDRNAAIKPTATETCNGIDDDCDTQIDEGVKTTWYLDADQDGTGNSTATTQACSAPTRYVSASGDCNDLDSKIGPSATEICDELDNDCDSQIDEGFNKAWYADDDVDGYGNAAVPLSSCSQPRATTRDATDCDDSRDEVNPGETEVCDLLDNDCDQQTDEGVLSTFYQDQDGDGFGIPSSTQLACTAPTGFVSNSTDCNDGSASIYPKAQETCNGVDEDCDSQIDDGVKITYYADADGDTFGNPASTGTACAPGNGLVTNSLDCNDTKNTVYPGAPEICDSLDNDCNNQIDEGGDAGQTLYYADGDNDGYGLTAYSKYACSKPAGHATQGGDCDDTNAQVHPNASELCNGKDSDCDGAVSPPSAPTVSNSGPVCSGSAVNFTASTLTGATYAWTGPSSFTSALQNPTIASATTAMAGTYSATVTVKGCVSPAATTSLVVNQANGAFTPSTTSGYINSAINFSAAASGATYAWTFQGASPASSTAQNPSATWTTAGSYSVSLTVTSNGCQATTSQTITISNSGASCKSIKQSNPSATSGNYLIDLDGSGPIAAASLYCDMTNGGGGWTRCLNFTNTSAEDVNNNTWLDTCVTYSNASNVGSEVMLRITNSGGTQAYMDYGSRSRAWSNDYLTSTAEASNQYHSGNHGYLVSFTSGDKLMIAGRFSTNAGCGGSMGNGYGITLYGSSPDYINNPKAFIMPYQHQVGYSGARSFNGWSTSHEISFNSGSTFNSCSSTPSWLGTAELYVR